MPLFWPPLHKYNHQPFKRVNKLRPAARGREAIKQKNDWECDRPERVPAGVNQQMCVYVGPNRKKRGTRKLVTVSKSWKKQYNKDYYEFVKAEGKPRARFNKTQPGFKFRKPKFAARQAQIATSRRARVAAVRARRARGAA